MGGILNTISWLVSLAFGIAFACGFSGAEGIIFGIVMGILIKFLFLSDATLKDALKNFSNQILDEANRSIYDRFDISQKHIIRKQKNIAEESKISTPKIAMEQKQTEEKLEILKIGETDEIYTKQKEAPLKIDTDLNLLQEQSKVGEIFQKDSVFRDFFKTNLLAKLGGIIVFIGVVFLISFAWMFMNDITRWALGLVIGICFYFAGLFFYKKEYTGEGIILLGTGILINFLVILAGRYILDVYPSETIAITGTFTLLIINSIIGIGTALRYKSETLLLFSFIFAFINPILIGGTSDTPYTLLIYTLLVSLSALFIAEKYNNLHLLLITFVLGNFFFLIAPHTTEIGFLTKFIFTAILSFLFINSKSVEEKLGKENTLFVNGIIFTPLLLQIITKNIETTILGYSLIVIVGFLCFFSLVWKAKKEKKPELFPLATGFFILLIIGVQVGADFIHIISFISIVTLGIINLLLPFYDKSIYKKENLGTFGISLISSSIAMGIVVLDYFLDSHTFENIKIEHVGGLFIAIAVIIHVIGNFVNDIFSIQSFKESTHKNLFLVYFGLFLGFFSIGISMIFAPISQGMIAVIWSVEAVLLYFLYSLTHDKRFIVFGSILFGISYIALLINGVSEIPNLTYVSTVILFLTALSLLFTRKDISNYSLGIHIAGIIVTHFCLMINYQIPEIPLLYIAITVILGVYYHVLKNTNLRQFFIWLFSIHMFIQVFSFLDEQVVWLGVLAIIAFFGLVCFINYKVQDHLTVKTNIIFTIFTICFWSIILLKITDTMYSLTIFWGIVGSILINIGIQRKQVIFRTVGLYLITLVAAKIFFYDIWTIGDPIIGTVIFIVLGIVLIGTSLLYTKYIGNDISSEFSWDNIYK